VGVAGIVEGILTASDTSAPARRRGCSMPVAAVLATYRLLTNGGATCSPTGLTLSLW
jgi:hypothetical protein